MAILDILTLPVRVGVAATHVTLSLGELVAPDGPVRRQGGYAERLTLVIGEGGYVERLARTLADPAGPMAVVNTLVAALSGDRPLSRALATGGIADRLLADDGPVLRLLEDEGALDRLLVEGGPLDRLVAPDGPLERLTADGGTLDQLVVLGRTLEAIAPRLAELGAVIPSLHESVDTLSEAVGPLGDLAGRLPRGRRRAIDA